VNDLTVISVVGGSDNGLLPYMIESVYKHTSPKPKILLCDTGSKYPSLDPYRSDPNIKIVKHMPPLKGGSNIHGAGLNALLPHITTPRVAIIETDCVITMNDWDKKIENTSLMAAVKQVYGGGICYHVAFMMFSNGAITGVNFNPGRKGQSNNKSYKPTEDVGWRIGYKDDKLSVKRMTFIDAKTGRGQVLGAGFQSDEFWIDGKCVVLHFGRGSNLGGKSNRKGFVDHNTQLANFKRTSDLFV